MKLHTKPSNIQELTLAAWREQLEQSREKPWLASLLLQQGERLLQRFASFYEYLRSLPRRTRRAIQRKTAVTIAGAALMLALSGTPLPLHAATIAVDDNEVTINSNSQCSLREAIINANNGAQTYSDCAAGSAGADTITLPTDGTFTITDAFDAGNKQGLPPISSEITINGNGSTIQRSTAGSLQVRILATTNTGNLTLNNTTISDGHLVGTGSYGYTDHGAGLYNNGITIINNCTFSNNGGTGLFGGAIYNDRTGGTGTRGRVTLNNSTITGSTAQYGGGIFNEGIVTLNNSTVTNNTATTQGGGIRSRVQTPTSAYFNQSIVAGNSAPTADEVIVDSGSSASAANYNLFGDSSNSNAAAFSNFTPSGTDITATSDGTNSTTLSSILNTILADNSGPTPTHALVSGSPAIDTIATTDANCNPGSSIDQRGGARANGVNQGGPACDTGAFEYGSTQTPTVIAIEGFTVHGEGRVGPAALGAMGVLALFTSSWLARARRRKA